MGVDQGVFFSFNWRPERPPRQSESSLVGGGVLINDWIFKQIFLCSWFMKMTIAMKTVNYMASRAVSELQTTV